MKSNNFWRLTRGYTLTNLLITLSIASILVSISIPSLGSLVARSETNQTVKNLFHLISYARQRAVNTRESVVICPTQDFENCENNWTSEIILFQDNNNDYVFQEDKDVLLSRQKLATKNQSINWLSFGYKPYLSFDAMGSTRYQNGRFYICDARRDNKAQLIVYRSGRTRYAVGDDLRDRCE